MIRIESSHEAADKALHLIENRRSGKWRSLKTRWNKLNKATMGGIEPNTVTTIGGCSGHGKTALAGMIIEDFMTENDNVVVLNFTLEMLPERLLLRQLSSRLGVRVRDLFSADMALDEGKMNEVRTELQKIAQNRVYYVSDPVSPDELESIILDFHSRLNAGQLLIIVIDHALLVKGKSGDGAKMTIDLLETRLNFLKKLNRILILQLSQLNRDIESSTRRLNIELHYPIKSDLSSSDNMYQLSDYVMIVHMPSNLGIQEYGPFKVATKDKVFVHILKSRDSGKPCVLQFTNDFAHNNLIEETPTEDDTQQKELLNE
jgi:replicative DNA helicase